MSALQEPRVDLAAAARFLDALAGQSGAAYTFQTFGDRKPAPPELARILHGTLADLAPEIERLNAAGAGVFVCVNRTNLTGRTAADVIGVRALFVDADGPVARSWALEPDILVTSSPEHTHAYWTICDSALEEFTPAQRHLAAFYGTDPKVCDLPRVLRVPGFLHQKAAPFMVHLVRARGGLPTRDVAEVLEAHPLPDAPAASAPRVVVSAPSPAAPDLEQRIFRASRWLAKADGAVAGQGGHEKTFDVAQALVRGFSLPPTVALDLLAAEYSPRCTPPWSQRELEHKVSDAADRSALPDGYLLGDSFGPPSRVLLGGHVLAPALAAGVPDPEDATVEALAAGRSVEELVPLIAAVGNEVTRDQLVKRVAHERHVSKTAVASEVRKARSRSRAARSGIRAVAPDGAPPAPELVEIRIEAGKLPAIVTAAEEALLSGVASTLAGTSAGSLEPVYQRGNILVRTFRTESLTVWRRRRQAGEGPETFRRASGALVIHPVDAAYLVDRFTAAARWLKFDGRAMDWRPADCPPKVAEVYMARAGTWRVRPLIGIIEAPTLRPDGSVLDEPGYDEPTGLLFDPGAVEFPRVPLAPSQEDARVALEPLLALLKDFPFVSSADRSAALSALLTGLIRKSIKTAPLHAFRAPKMRSGKTLLADLVSLLATGRTCAVLSQNYERPDEEKKRLLAVLLAGDPVVCYDNIDRPFGGAALCQALTQETISDRILGVSQMATAPTAATFLATGNNLIFEDDITSRVVPCDLDPEMERPEERRFSVNLYDHVPAHRAELVTAALTVLRAYHVAGRPDLGLAPWGGFEEWSGWVRSAIVWMGQEDPAEGKIRVEELDPARQRLRQLLAAWDEAVRGRVVTLAEVIKESALPTNEDLKNAMIEVAGSHGEIDPRKLGRFLSTNEKRIEGGRRFVRAGVNPHSKVSLWTVVSARTPLNPAATEVAGVDLRGTAGSAGSVLANTREMPVVCAHTLFDLNPHGPKVPRSTPLNPADPTCPLCGGSMFKLSSKTRTPICQTCFGLPMAPVDSGQQAPGAPEAPDAAPPAPDGGEPW